MSDFLEEDEEFDYGSFYETEEEEGDEDDATEEEEDDSSSESGAGERMTSTEMKLSFSYDNIVAAAKDGNKNDIGIHNNIDIFSHIVRSDPRHSSEIMVNDLIKGLLHKQGEGHNRFVNGKYTPDGPMSRSEVNQALKGDDDIDFNGKYLEEARSQVARFIGYLASRDISKDSVISKRRKQRHIPAFIIFLFSSNMYDLVIDCPTMPEVYAKQIEQALHQIMKNKYDIVEALAERYEKEKRPEVAKRVREYQLRWFLKEPAEIKTSAEFSDLELTLDDVIIYREFRSKFTNTSKAITQDVISDLIEVVVEDGVSERLKDKTRKVVIDDVKQVYKNWAKDNPIDSELASKVIWKDI